MSFLLCTFASARSQPERIHRFIAYLEKLRHTHGDHPDRVQTIEHLLKRAHQWLS